MDPLSITAGTIAVVGACNTIRKGFAKILALRGAPDILFALNNEVSDLAIVAQDVQSILDRHIEVTGFEPPLSMCQASERLQGHLERLDNLIAYELTTVRGKDNEVKLDRSVWLRVEPQVQRLKEEIRDDRIRMASASGLLAALFIHWLQRNAMVKAKLQHKGLLETLNKGVIYFSFLVLAASDIRFTY
ncbi:hypothetical protein P7C71_g4769, partial [Lecanoromycetidae sp. Uapishka_2]